VATLKEYFLKDFANALTVDFTCKMVPSQEQDISVKVGVEIHSSAYFIAYYVPAQPDYRQIFANLIDAWPQAINRSKNVEVITGFVGDVHAGIVGSNHSVFANRIYIYTENIINDTDIDALDEFCKTRSIWLTVRGNAYMAKKLELEKPLAFISHDSRDKTEVAAPIALGLQKMLCPVWYDEYSLKVGDNLRQTIERGLKETKKCILILSPNFLANNGWTRTEFDSVFTREIVEGNGVVLPVWYNITHREVYEYSPSLANKVAVNWNLGAEEVVRRLYGVIMAQ
jgi:hypothetical protein